jgi:imidazole glycerol phosphate synthase subunit HisF
VQTGYADAVAIADILHYDRSTVAQIKVGAAEAGIPVRRTA